MTVFQACFLAVSSSVAFFSLIGNFILWQRKRKLTLEFSELYKAYNMQRMLKERRNFKEDVEFLKHLMEFHSYDTRVSMKIGALKQKEDLVSPEEEVSSYISSAVEIIHAQLSPEYKRILLYYFKDEDELLRYIASTLFKYLNFSKLGKL